jgi:5' nucleotidase, deoxy (Pyrimidine), cytosolic type C protein (NT5C)
MIEAILVDMDGVLVDFIGGALKAHGLKVSSTSFYSQKQHLGKWNVETLMGLTDEEFWKPIDREFWTNLEPTHDGLEMLGYIEMLFGLPNVYLWTSPCKNDGCYDGKRDWIRKYLNKQYLNKHLIAGPAKHLGAGPNKILVDDADHNVSAFSQAGGISCLVPRLWNQYHEHAHVSLTRVKDFLTHYAVPY